LNTGHQLIDEHGILQDIDFQ